MAGGGAERQLSYLASEQVRLGCDVHVAIIHGGPNLPRLVAAGATVHRLPAFGNHDPQILIRLIRTVRAIKPDAVQCWLLQTEVLGGLAALWTGPPWVLNERASEEAYPRTFKMWCRV
jgi:Glycosyl transferase 4-like domain